MQNLGYDPQEIANLKAECQAAGQNYLLNDEDPDNEEFVHFYFVGNHEGKEVIFDTLLYTLRVHHSSLLYEMAEEKAVAQFPNYQPRDLEQDEHGNLVKPDDYNEEIEQYKAEVIADLEESETVKVQEHVEVDADFEYGISLDVALNVDEITHETITKFVDDYNASTLQLDDTLFSFTHDEDYEDDDDAEEAASR